MTTVRAADAEELPWLEERTRCVLGPDTCALKAQDAGGSIRGMAAFHGWTHSAAQMVFAVDAPIICRRLLPAAFEYVFRQAARQLVLVLVASHSRRAVRLAERVGFRRAFAVRDGFAPGDDLLLYELRDEDCRWRKGDVAGTPHGKAA